MTNKKETGAKGTTNDNPEEVDLTSADFQKTLTGLAADDIDGIKKLNDDVIRALKSKETALEESLKTVQELAEELSLKEAVSADDTLLVNINKKPYKLVGKSFQTRKGKMSAQELAKDVDLLAELQKKGSGILSPYEKEEIA